MVDALGPGLVALVAAALVVLLWRRGKKADQARAPQVQQPEEQTNADLWREISEGRDPTDLSRERSE